MWPAKSSRSDSAAGGPMSAICSRPGRARNCCTEVTAPKMPEPTYATALRTHSW